MEDKTTEFKERKVAKFDSGLTNEEVELKKAISKIIDQIDKSAPAGLQSLAKGINEKMRGLLKMHSKARMNFLTTSVMSLKSSARANSFPLKQ